MDYRNRLSKVKGKREQLETQLQLTEDSLKRNIVLADHVLEAQAVIQMVAQKTQEELSYHIESIVTMAMEAVLIDPYELEVDFDIKRGKTEAVLWFVRNGKSVKPLHSTGGGAKDIASLALRVTAWSLGKKRPVLILDEPAKNVSRDLQAKTGLIIKELSKKLGIQFIISSHIPEIITGADTVVNVKMVNGISTIESVQDTGE